MKLFSDSGGKNLDETSCIGISASPNTLREIAKFLANAANELEEIGSEFGHLHLMDEWGEWSDGMPDIQVFGDKI